MLHDGYLYWVSESGIANCVNAKNGERVYQERLPDTGRVYASALSVDGRLYVVTREKGTFVLARQPEFKRLALNKLAGDQSVFNASPVAHRGQLLLRSNTFLYCLGKNP